MTGRLFDHHPSEPLEFTAAVMPALVQELKGSQRANVSRFTIESGHSSV
jgi:hypothetical protein